MVLRSLTLQNFKGVKKFTLETGGRDVAVLGDNAVGKTTLFDACNWLLFDKDSQNKSDFGIKTLTATGEPHHGLDHEVEGTFELGSQSVTLRKVYSEKWTKKRGSAQKLFEGHTTDYFIDDVPVAKKEYQARIADIAPEATFKLLTSPTYFNEALHWQDRRKVLLDICGDVSDAEVIASKGDLSRLPEILGERTLDDHRKVIAARRSLINKELVEIPNRIDEVERGLPGTDHLDAAEIQKSIDDLSAKKSEKEQELARIQAGGEIAEKTKRLREIQGELIDIANAHKAKASEGVDASRDLLGKAKSRLAYLESDIATTESQIQAKQRSIKICEERREELTAQWHVADQREFKYFGNDTCPACEQSLPAEKVEAATASALATFNLGKSNDLEGIDRQGKEATAERDRLSADIPVLESRIADFRAKATEEQMTIDRLTAEVEAATSSTAPLDENPDYQKKLAEESAINAEIEQLNDSNVGRMDEVRAAIGDLSAAISALEFDRASFAIRAKGDLRIHELKDQEKALAAEYEELEGELFLCEEFVKAKVAMLEDRIAAKFDRVRFKMFAEQVNGGITECCETLVNGVPYSAGLNNAARINAGLEIIEVLSAYHNLSAPIFVDNAEAVVSLRPVSSQVISLVVSEGDKTLRVEAVDALRKAV